MMTRSHDPQQLRLLTICSSSLFLFSSCAGCSGENNASQSNLNAQIEVQEFSPDYAFPSQENTLTFSITPSDPTLANEVSWRVDFGDGASSDGQGTENVSQTHTYEFGGTFDVSIQAIHNGAVIAETTEARTVYEPIDVAISESRSQPANANSGQAVTLIATLENNLAADVLIPLDVHAYLSTTPSVTLDDIDSLTAMEQATITPLQSGDPVLTAGQERPISIDATVPESLSSGDYYLVLVIDPQQELVDTDRANNITVGSTPLRIVNASQIQPDLLTTSITVAPDRAFPELNRFTRSATLQNNGGLDLFDVVVETYLSTGDNTLDDGDILVHTSAPITQITARGGTASVEAETILLDQAIVPPANSSLDVYVIAKAYSTEDIEESDTSNNILASSSPIIVTDQPVDGPDIVVDNFQVTPLRTFINGTLEYAVDISNEGTSDVSSFICRVYLAEEPRVDTLRDQPLDSINIPNLASTETRQIVDTVVVNELFDPGTYYSYVLCDPNNTLGEPFRSNNQQIFEQPIQITNQSDVDLFVRNLSVPTDAAEGDTVTLNAEICTTGANATGPTKADLFRSPGNRVDFTQDPLLTLDVPNINPGECVTLPIEVTTSCTQFQSQYAFGLTLDSTQALPENDESNNTRSGDNILTLTGALCSCVEDTYEPNNRPLDAKNIPDGSSSLALCEAGSCDFFRTSDLQPDDSLIITNTFDPAQGLLSTRLFNPDGIQVIDQDRSENGTQQVASFLGAGGSFVIEVCGTTPQTKNLYDLGIQVISPDDMAADILIQNVSIPPQNSFSLGAEFDVSFDLYNLGKLAADSVDVDVRISTDDTIDANDPLLANITIPLLESTSQTMETIPVKLPTTLTEGTYHIGVVASSPATTPETDTTNNSAVSSSFEVSTLCYDPLEPNDSFDDAYSINASATFSNLISCTNAADYYEICVENGKKFTVSTSFTHANGDIDLELFDAQRIKIDDSATQNDQESVSVDYVNGDQCYTVRAYIIGLQGQPAVENLYELQVNIEDVDPSLLCTSYGEPNNDFNDATSLVAASQVQNIDRCPAVDSDFFYFDIGAIGQTFTISATKTPATQPGTLRLQLYTPSQLPDLNDETAPDQPTASISNYIAPQTGRYWVKVTATGATRNVTYSLAISGLTGIDLNASNLTIGPGTYREGDAIRLGFDLLNVGSDATATPPNFTLSIGQSPTPNPTLDVSFGSLMAQNALPGNSSEYIFVPLTVPSGLPTGTSYIHLVIDDTDDINPTNNVHSIPIQIVP